jgi:hypothetical protein
MTKAKSDLAHSPGVRERHPLRFLPSRIDHDLRLACKPFDRLVPAYWPECSSRPECLAGELPDWVPLTIFVMHRELNYRRKAIRLASRLRAVGYKVEIEAGRMCRVCSCTQTDCRHCITRLGRPCSWVELDLCSACVEGHPASGDVVSDPMDIAG